MKEKSRLTVFGFLLLGLIQNRPQSGYSIRKTLKFMPISHFTDSPGSVYPALEKLEKTGLIVGKNEGAALRPRKVFSITNAGKKILEQWLRSSLDTDDILRHPEGLFVRLSFSDLYFKNDELAAFVQSFLKLVRSLKAELKVFQRSAGPRMQQGGNLATELALENLTSYIRWAEKTLKFVDKN